MPVRYVCAECNSRVSLPNDRQGLKNDCPHCEAPLPDHPARSGSGLVIGIVVGVCLLGCIGVGGLAAAFWLVLKEDDPQQKQVVAQVEPEPVEQPAVPIENPAPRVEDPAPPAAPLPKHPPTEAIRPAEKESVPPPDIPKENQAPKAPPVAKPVQPDLMLPPLPNPVYIRPSPISEEKTFRLPEPWERSVVGGGGRYIVMQFQKTKKIGIFDVNIAKIASWIDLAEERIEMAAGMSKLFVFYPSVELVRRYDLATGKEETSRPLRLKAVTAFTMGHSSAGPLLIRSSVGARLYNTDNLAEIPVPNDPAVKRLNRPDPPSGRTLPIGDGEIFPSGDARTIGNSSPAAGIKVLSFEDGRVILRSNRTSTPYVIPGPDGRHIFAAGHNPVSIHLTPTGDTVATGLEANVGRGAYLYAPATHGPFYMQIAGADKRPGLRVPAPAEQSVRIFHYGLNLPALTIPIPPELGGEDWDARVRFALSAVLVPRANLIVFRSKDSLRLIPIDLDKGLQSTGEQFLFVSSAPPATYRSDAALRYPILAKSKAGDIQFKLESGSDGMAVDREGVLTWKPPTGKKDPVDVVVSLKDKSGRVAKHRFTLTLDANRDAAVVAPDPAVPKEVAQGSKDAGRIFPAIPNRLPVKPLDSTERRVYKLPSATTRAIPAGGGRFLVLHFSNRTIGVFDVNEGKIVRFIPVAEDRPLLAAGMTKLAVYLPSAKLIQRYSLLTGEREASKELDLADIKAMAMGAASAGPIAIAAGSGGRIFDLETFAEIDVPKEMKADRFGRPIEEGNPRLPFRAEKLSASADGRVFAGEGGVAWITGSEMKFRRTNDGTWVYAQPSPDGRYVFHGGTGASTVEGEKTSDVAYSMGERGGSASYFFLPSIDGPFYVHVHFSRFRGREARFGGDPDRGLSIYMYGVDTPISRIIGLREMPEYELAGPKSGMPFNEQIHLVSRAKQMLVFGPSRDRITIIPIDPLEALDQASIDRLLVTSTPPGAFKPGTELIYPIRARSKSGGFKYQVSSGPPGMKVSPLGVISWSIPARFDDREVSVIVSVRDAAGREVFQSFRLVRSEKNVEYVPDPEPEPAINAGAKDNGPRIGYALPPIPSAVDFDSTPVEGRIEVAIPHKYDTVIAGGRGRYLILQARAARKAIVFDMADKTVKHTIDLGEENASVAAGMTQMLVYRPSKNEIEKFSLATGKSAGTKLISFKNATEMLMGSASAGPLLIRSAHHAELYDVEKLQPMNLPGSVKFPFVQGRTWVSANGRAFGNSVSNSAGSYVHTAVLEEKAIRESTALAHSPYAVPDFDGSQLYFGGIPQANISLKENPSGAPLSRLPNDEVHFLPASSPEYFLMLHLDTPPPQYFQIPQKTTNKGVTIVHREHKKGAAVIADMPELSKDLIGSASLPMLVHFVPEADALAAVPTGRDKLVIYPAAIKDARLTAKQAIEWKLPDVPPAALPKVAPIAQRKSVEIPGKVFEVAVGGAGRFLVCQVEAWKLVILDLAEGKFLPEMRFNTNRISFAATMDKLVVCESSGSTSCVLRRYDLLTGKLEKSAGVEFGRIELAAGSASNGPIVLSSPSFPTKFIDLASLAPMKAPGAPKDFRLEGNRTSVSADGRTIVSTGRAPGSMLQVTTVRLKPEGFEQTFHGERSFEYLAISPDAKRIFLGGGAGIVGPDLKPVADAVVSAETDPPQSERRAFTFAPAVEGPYYLHVHVKVRGKLPRFAGDPLNGVTFYKYGVEKPLGHVADLIDSSGVSSLNLGSMRPYMAYHFYPSAKLLVAVDRTAKKIHLVPIDPDDIPPLAPPAPKADPKSPAKPRSKSTPKTRPKPVVPNPVPSTSPKGQPKNPLKAVDPNAAPMAETVPFRHTPLPEPLPIKPAVAATFSFNEPSRMSPPRIRLAGGGRFVLIQRNPDKIDLFDLNEGKVVRQIEVGSSYWLAGMTKLYVFEDNHRQIRRFDLLTGKGELARGYASQVVPLAMGMSTNGPLAVRGREGLAFIDGESLALMTFPARTIAAQEFFNKSCWASPDGRAFGVGMLESAILGPRSPASATLTFTLGADGVRKSSGSFPSLYAVPDSTGRYLFSGGHGVFGMNLAKTTDAVRSEEPSPQEPPVHFYLPAAEGPFYLKYPASLPALGPRPGPPMRPRDRNQQSVDVEYNIYAFGQLKPIAQVKAPDPLSDRGIITMGRLRDLVQLVPSANALVIAGGDKIHVVPVDLNAEMKKSGVEVPWVSSLAPRTFKAGEAISYPLKLHNGADGAEFSLEASAPGMTISKDGVFQWKPAADAPAEVKPVIRIKRAGKETVYSFVLTKQ